MLSANYTFIALSPCDTCVCVDYSITAAIANRNVYLATTFNYKFLQGKGRMQNIDAEWQYA